MAEIGDWFFGLFGRRARTEDGPTRKRGLATHVIILDGTMSTLAPGMETNAGLTFKLLREAGRQANLTVYYESGVQWRDWSGTWSVITGKGINRQIQRAYGVLASRFRPGDRIILIWYSRGAYAVRSLAGVIDLVGLVRHDEATERVIRQAYRHYRTGGRSVYAAKFRALYTHPEVMVAAVGVWDTVKALGLRLPLIWRWTPPAQTFHSQALGDHVLHGFHALAIDERREAYAPVLWQKPPGWNGVMEQVWFRGTHGDVGGQLGDDVAARPLANIPLVWMLGRLATCGLLLPDGWQARFPQDANAPSIGSWSGWGKLFLSRRRRIIGKDASEMAHPTLTGHRLRHLLPP